MAKPPFELLSNKIIKNLFLNVNRKTGMGREEMEGKILKDPSPLPSPAEWRGEKEKEKSLKEVYSF
jgi:hypothetical protein